MTREENKVSLVIPAYNNRMLFENNLGKIILAKNNKVNQILEVIIVDDGSSDESGEFIKKNFPEIRLFTHKLNRGFAAAVNTGVRMAKGNLVCLLNSDVIPDEDFLAGIFADFKNDEVFAVSLHERGFGWAKGVFKDGFVSHEPGGEDKEAHITFWVSGGSGVFRRDLWMKLGGMDESIFSPFYWEDLDLSYRALKKGLTVLWEPKGLVNHEHESTIGKLPAGRVSRIRERNQLLFNWKNLTSANFLAKHISGLLKRVAGHPGYLKIVFLALAKLPQIIRARKKVYKESRVSDEAIFARFK